MFAMSNEIPSRVKLFWAHVLRRAVFDYVLYKGVGARHLDWQRAANYIFSPGLQYENGVAFEEVCELFGWDPDYIRRLTVQLDRSDIKRMETSSFKEDLTQDVFEAMVKESSRWRITNSALPFYPRMIDDFASIATPRVVHRESLVRKVPLVQWHAVA